MNAPGKDHQTPVYFPLVIMLLAMSANLHAADTDASWPACGQVDTYPGKTWAKAGPVDGWNAELLAKAEANFNSIDSASMMVIWRGHPIAAWGSVAEPYLIQSVRKPVINAIAGQLVDEGKLTMSMTLGDFSIQDYDPTLSETSLNATVADVFHSRSGVLHPAHYEVGGWKRVRGALTQFAQTQYGEPALPPGQVWFYNNWDFNAAGEIVARAAGTDLAQLLEERIVQPLSLQDFQVDEHLSWEMDGDLTAWAQDNHSAIPAYLLEMSARDLARVGLLNLGCGNWDGKRILSEDWVRSSMTGIPTGQGAPDTLEIANRGSYGYLWFVEQGDNRSNWLLNDLPPFYYHSGNRGHRLYVMPKLDLVISHLVATTGGTGFAGQMKRNIFGSPEVGQLNIEKLVSLVVAAHPDPDARWAAEQALLELSAWQQEQADSQE